MDIVYHLYVTQSKPSVDPSFDKESINHCHGDKIFSILNDFPCLYSKVFLFEKRTLEKKKLQK